MILANDMFKWRGYDVGKGTLGGPFTVSHVDTCFYYNRRGVPSITGIPDNLEFAKYEISIAPQLIWYRPTKRIIVVTTYV